MASYEPQNSPNKLWFWSSLSVRPHRGLLVVIIIAIFIITCARPCHGGSYSQKKAIFDKFFSSSTYNPNIRPLLDQDQKLEVSVGFELVSIVEINDVFQSFQCNGFLSLAWVDEIVRWNASDYGGVVRISPKTADIFRPRLVLLNTMEDRDLFEDDAAPTNIYYNGITSWTPGSIFPASCQLNLRKYPFDEQICGIMMIVMSYDGDEITFTARRESVGRSFYTQNGEWAIVSTAVSTPLTIVEGNSLSSIVVTFTVKRKPTFLVLSILLPIVFLSLLNLLVFVIPVESGEKISYGITVLLALTVFMSIISGMLPRSSESMPLVITYIFILLTISVLTVVDSVIIVKLHHMEEEEEKSQNAQQNFKATLPKIALLRRAVSPMGKIGKITGATSNGKPSPLAQAVDEEQVDYRERGNSLGPGIAGWTAGEQPRVNKYRVIGKYIDMVSLAAFGLVWLSTTMGFLLAIAV